MKDNKPSVKILARAQEIMRTTPPPTDDGSAALAMVAAIVEHLDSLASSPSKE